MTAPSGWSRRGPSIDHTDAMSAWARKRLTELERENLSGYVLKKDSPSCGMERVKVFGASGRPERTAVGIFAEALLRRFPNLPVEEEGRLSDPRLRENFIERVFAYQRLRRFFAGGGPSAGWSRSIRRTRCRCSSHSTAGYRELGRLVAVRCKHAARCAPRRLRIALHADADPDRDASAAHQRADAHGRASEETAGWPVKTGTGDNHRRVPSRADPARRSDDAAASPCAAPRRRLPSRARPTSSRIRES